MKLLDSERNSSAEETAAHLAEIVPLVMRTIRTEMRKHRDPDLSVPQFRALAFVGRNPGASLSDVATHVGLTLPSISKMIDRLVARKLVARQSAAKDRRRISLELTPLGVSTLESSRSVTRARLAEKLAVLSPEEQKTVIQAMDSLQKVFGAEPIAEEEPDEP